MQFAESPCWKLKVVCLLVFLSMYLFCAEPFHNGLKYFLKEHSYFYVPWTQIITKWFASGIIEFLMKPRNYLVHNFCNFSSIFLQLQHWSFVNISLVHEKKCSSRNYFNTLCILINGKWRDFTRVANWRLRNVEIAQFVNRPGIRVKDRGTLCTVQWVLACFVCFT